MESSLEYKDATNKLVEILTPQGYAISNDESLKRISILSKATSLKDYNIEKDQLGGRIFIFLFMFVMLLIAGYKNITTSFIIYAAVIGLLVAFISTISSKTKIIIDYQNEIVSRNNRKVRFSDCKRVRIDNVTVNLIPISYIVTIETKMGQIDLSLISVNDKDIAEQIRVCINKFIFR